MACIPDLYLKSHLIEEDMPEEMLKEIKEAVKESEEYMQTKEIFDLINQEKDRQENEICLIASENYTSADVMKAQGSCLTQKYAEGYPGHRYYAGCEIIDKIEQAAIDNACKLFDCKFANVQPHSGASANLAVLKAFCNAGDTILGMSLDEGGHLTHGAKPTISGKWFDSIQYGLDDNGYLNYDEIKMRLYSYNPRLLIVGASAYPRAIDFKKIRDMLDEYNDSFARAYQAENELDLDVEEIIEKFGCKLMVDMAHIAGLVAAGLHQSPLPYADVVTSTTHKTLRGPRGGIILWNNEKYTKKINSAVFPGCQGGPLEHVIAGKAVCFAEALQPEFKEYASQVLKNIKAMENIFLKEGVKLISGGSDNHLLLIDLKETNVTGQLLETVLEKIGIVTNKNAVKNDTRPKTETSGLRVGTAAVTTRGATENDCSMMAHIIATVIDQLNDYGAVADKQFEISKNWVARWCKEHPIYK